MKKKAAPLALLLLIFCLMFSFSFVVYAAEDDSNLQGFTALPWWVHILIGAGAVILLGMIVVLAVVLMKKLAVKKEIQDTGLQTDSVTTSQNASAGLRESAQLQNIGARKSQQDSKGIISYSNGTLAVVADGMGGLADGDKVSQKIVQTMMADGSRLDSGTANGFLFPLVAHANKEVNRMLGSANQYKCGSTLLAVAVENNGFQWASVGDSRIYLYRAGQLLQINREHIYMTDLVNKAVNGEISFREIMSDSQVKRVSSFIGMGRLKYVDGSTRPVPIQTGDRILLMTDGVFNTLAETEICLILREEETAEKAARRLEQQVLLHNNPNQDNFTAVILDI